MTDEATDAIRTGMEKWEQTRQAATEAVERCRVAEDKAARLEARSEILENQNHDLTEANVRLRSQVEDAKVGLAAAMAALLAAKDNLTVGDFRAPGSVKVNNHPEIHDQIMAGLEREFAPKAIPQFLQQGPVVKS